MTTSLHDKIALVIGGTRGIGAAITKRIAADGASVAAIHLSRSDEAAALADTLRAKGTDILIIQADIANPAALEAAIDTAIDRFGRIDILVNAAGLAITGTLESYPADAFDRVFSVNVRAPFLACQRAVAAMPDGGRIVTIGSIVASRAPGAGATLYAASKAALVGMTRGMARDLGPRGITVNLVQPGPIDTERNPADGPNATANRSPLAIARHGTAEEVAGLVAYLPPTPQGSSPVACTISMVAGRLDVAPGCPAPLTRLTADHDEPSCRHHHGQHFRLGDDAPCRRGAGGAGCGV